MVALHSCAQVASSLANVHAEAVQKLTVVASTLACGAAQSPPGTNITREHHVRRYLDKTRKEALTNLKEFESQLEAKAS